MMPTVVEAEQKAAGCCKLCGRHPKNGTTEHHLIPRVCHRNKWFQKRYSREQMAVTIALCRDCHAAIHRFVPREKDLGRYFNTRQDLLGHAQIGAFVSWVRQRR